MANASNKSKPAGAAGFKITTFPKEFERNIWEELDRRFYIIILSALAVVYGFVIYLGNKDFPKDLVNEQIKQSYLKKVYEAEFVQEPVAEAETEGEGAGPVVEEEAEEPVDERAQKDVGKREEATGTSAAERRAMRRRAAARRNQQRAAMEQEVAGTGVLGVLSAGGGGGVGEAVTDVFGDESGTGTGSVGDLDQVLESVGGLQTASSSSRRSQLGARSSGGGDVGSAKIDDLIEGGVGPSGSASIKRQGGFSIKMEEGSVSGKASKSTARSAEAISRVVNRHADAVENCYKREARVNPNLKGSITVQFTILPDGRVSGVRVLESTIRSRRVESCVSRRIRSWRFERIDASEGKATFKQKFVFTS